MKNQFHLLSYLKFNKVLKCAQELDNLVKERDPKERVNLIKEVKDCVIDAISEVAKNCLIGNIPLSKEDFSNLSKYQHILRLISRPSSIERRRKLIQRGSGFIDTLLPAALILITYIINKIIDGKNE